MRRITANSLTQTQRQQMISPITTAIIALRMGRGSSAHYHDIAAQLMIAHRIAELVPRHRHLMVETQAALNALNTMFDRCKQRTVTDAYIAGADDEVDALDLAAQVYAALLKTTPLKTIRRAILNITNETERANADAIHG